MTISTTIAKNSSAGNGSTTAFTYSFKITDQSHIKVYIRVDSTGAETLKTLTTHYTVSGVGAAAGGTVTFTSGNIPASGETVVMLRATPKTQAPDLLENAPFPAPVFEDSLDKLTAVTQELEERLDRALTASETDSTTLELPNSTVRADRLMSFDSSGNVTTSAFSASIDHTSVLAVGRTTTTDEKIQFRDTGLYIASSTDGQLDIVADGEVQITATTIDLNGAIALDGEITGATNITLSGELDAGSLDVSGNADIDGTTNLDAVDIDGAVQIDATVTVGVDDQGYDFKLFGDTASAYLLWDTSADKLLTAGGATIDIVKDKLLIGSTAVTTTAAELNILDGVTSTTAELNILDGVTSTAAEINLIDGGTARGTTAVASGDGILINDAGTMRMTNVDTVSTYFSSHNVGGGNIVTTGALNSGSITSGFGSIDNGSSAITTTGDISGGTVNATGDTSAGDDAAIGYTSAEGLILTGQGSTSDITLKNDADATVFTVPTGTDDILFPDDAKAMWGDGSDLQIYHDASNSYIVDSGTGNLKLAASQIDLLGGADAGETMATFADDGAVTLYHNNVAKIATSATGATVTGTLVATTSTAGSQSGSTTLDFGANQNFVLTLTGNITLANPTTEQVGQSGVLVFVQDGTGSRTLSLSSDFESAGGSGITLSTAANAVDIIPYFVKAANSIQLGAVQKAFS